MSENENENQSSSCPRACYRANFSSANNKKVEPLPYVGINAFQVIPKTPAIHITIDGDAAVQALLMSTRLTAKDSLGAVLLLLSPPLSFITVLIFNMFLRSFLASASLTAVPQAQMPMLPKQSKSWLISRSPVVDSFHAMEGCFFG